MKAFYAFPMVASDEFIIAYRLLRLSQAISISSFAGEQVWEIEKFRGTSKLVPQDATQNILENFMMQGDGLRVLSQSIPH
ncbi:hypothetical protein [Cupriavidus alkaliphilus]|uniref:hypothetical protein n=1 Tax=Cupriavidus alkaliphilus TaxID=942866 RepID=UPI0016197A6C|nr:hypothetical protein [Cupriavidus alkaliphilus]MBB3014212.1 hypothetical protein [Cupriavidus alkaliphilus]